jgi:quercetin dioxygenase-like cupin family protein
MSIEVITSQDGSMSHPEPGLRRQVMSSSPSMMLVRHRMKKGWVGARHSHPHEQMVFIVSGHLSFQHPGGVVEAKMGDSFLVPGNVEHQAFALEDSEVLDIFTPRREDYTTS